MKQIYSLKFRIMAHKYLISQTLKNYPGTVLISKKSLSSDIIKTALILPHIYSLLTHTILPSLFVRIGIEKEARAISFFNQVVFSAPFL